MRVEPYEVGSCLHVIKRGARGLDIVRDESDRVRFRNLLYYLNDEFQGDNWERSTEVLTEFQRPSEWPERKPLVHVLAWVLMPNHFHLCLQEIQEGGVSKFMQRLCGSMSAHFNAKYDEKGSLFQGAFKSRTISSDDYLRYLAPYIMVKNVFELYPNGGLDGVMGDFESAWNWATKEYKFSSLPVYAEGSDSPIIERGAIDMIFESAKFFKERSYEMIFGYKRNDNEEYRAISLEEW